MQTYFLNKAQSHFHSHSQVVEVVLQLVTRDNSQVVRIICNLMSVHHTAGHLDRAHEVEVIVAQVVGELLYFDVP